MFPRFGAAAGGNRCPGCGRRLLESLEIGEICSACAASSPWTAMGSGEQVKRIVITLDDVDQANEIRTGEAGKHDWRFRIICFFVFVLSGSLTGSVIYTLVQLFGKVEATGLDEAISDYTNAATTSVVLGLIAFVGGVWGLRSLNRSRLHRTMAFVVLAIFCVVVGTVAIGSGGLALVSVSSFGFDHTTMPPLNISENAGDGLDINRRATVVIFSSDNEGSFLRSGLGSGSVVDRTEDRVTILTSRHVVLPGISTSTVANPDDFEKVWINYADGRKSEANILWVAPPPVDLALLETSLKNAPEPVSLYNDIEELVPGNPLYFLPNPYRDGWRTEHGSVVSRRVHNTPIGAFSLIITNLPVQSGDSGGGLYNHADQLVGVITWRAEKDGAPQGISLPSDALSRYWRVK